MNKLLKHPPFPTVLSATVLLALIIAFLFLSGCGIFRSGSAGTESITETSGLTEGGGEIIVTDAYETTVKAEMTPHEKLLELIRSENKSITGDFIVMEQWIWMYAEAWFPDGIIPASAERLSGAVLWPISDEYTPSCEKFNLVFQNGKSEAVSVIDVSVNDTRYLVDLVIDSDVEKMNRTYVYEALKSDSRFSGGLYESIDNKFDTGINEYNITEITGRDPDIWYFNKLMTELDGEGMAKLYFDSKDRSRTVYVIADLTNQKILSEEEPEVSENLKSSDTVLLPTEVSGGKYIINQDQDFDLYITNQKNGERILIYDSYAGDDISKINVARLFKIYDDRLVIYCIGLYEGTAGFGIYNIETKENRLFTNELSPVFISGDMLYARSDGIYSSNHGFIRIDLTGDLDDHYDMLALNGINPSDPDVASILSPDGKYLLFLFVYDYESSPVRSKLMVCDSIDGRIIDSFDIVANGCGPQYLKFTDDNVLLILCERHAMCDDFIFTFDLRVLNKNSD